MDGGFVTVNFVGFDVQKTDILIEFFVVGRIVEIQDADLEKRLQFPVISNSRY